MAPIVLTPQEKSDALAKAGSDLKFLFGKEDINEDYQAIFYHVGITSVARFASFAKDVDDLKLVLKNDVGLDPTKSLQERSIVAAFVCAFTSAQTRSSKLAEVEAEMESRQWTKTIPPSDYLAMRMSFDKRHWRLEDREIPSKDYLEKKLEQMESGEWAAEALTEVVSKDECEPETLQPIWDRTGRLTVKKGSSTVPMPSNPEELRRRLSIMCHGLIMLSMRHVNRYELQGIDPGLFEKYKSYLLGEHVLGLQAKDASGETVGKPPWHLVMSYEHAIRKRAIRMVNESGCTIPFNDALKQSWADPIIKERYFTTPLALIVHRGSAGRLSHNDNNQRPGGGNQNNSWPGKGTKRKGDGKNKTSKGEGKGKRSSKTPDGRLICYRYNNQKEKCKGKKCNFEHVCTRCFGKHPQYECKGAHLDTSGSA
jgi:hypothetical protein